MEEEFVDFVAGDCTFVKSLLSLLGNVHEHLDLLWNLSHKIKFCFLFHLFQSIYFVFKSPSVVVFVHLTSLVSP
ncbi:hypothetical protein Bca4012_044905 [Brassica carinata]